MQCGLASVKECNCFGWSASDSRHTHLSSCEANMKPSSGPMLGLERKSLGAVGYDYVRAQLDGLCPALWWAYVKSLTWTIRLGLLWVSFGNFDSLCCYWSAIIDSDLVGKINKAVELNWKDMLIKKRPSSIWADDFSMLTTFIRLEWTKCANLIYSFSITKYCFICGLSQLYWGK